MKNSAIIIFLSIVLILYTLLNFYILRRGWQAFAGANYRTLLFAVFLAGALSYPAGRFLEQLSRTGLTQSLVFAGSFYLGVMVYLFLLVLLLDIFRLGNHFLHFFPAIIRDNPQSSARFAGWGVILIAMGTIFFGHLNALHPRVRTLDITINKPAGGLQELNIVMASDIHLGTVIRNSRLVQIVERINSLNPDLILLPGDVVDEDVGPVSDQNMAQTFHRLRARYGVYGITGNHEYIGGVKEAVAYLKKSGIVMLQDSVVKVADAFYLAGRKDRSAERMAGGRKTLEAIMAGVDTGLPVILMDHQPFGLGEAQRNGIDLQLSGHTHHGQLFPFNFITEMVYEKSWGYLRKGDTQYYVSCGAGTWGPPARTGNRPEIVQIKVRFGG